MANSFSFDIVSDFDRQELVNAFDQIKREVEQRYDLKDSNTEFDLQENELIIITASEMTLLAITDILRQKATKRKLSLKIFDFQSPESSGGNRIKQRILFKRGLNKDIAKTLSKKIRNSIKKVTVSIQGECLRVTSKSKDDLQLVIAFMKEQEEELNIPLQFENYR